MPSLKNEFRDGLPVAIVHLLATGTLLPSAAPPGAGRLRAFEYLHAWRDRARTPAIIDEFRRLWSRHEQEIMRAAAPATPWVVTALTAPVTDGDDQEEGDDEDTRTDP
jgi:hypothetical protein